jgi:hypothetical protein
MIEKQCAVKTTIYHNERDECGDVEYLHAREQGHAYRIRDVLR